MKDYNFREKFSQTFLKICESRDKINIFFIFSYYSVQLTAALFDSLIFSIFIQYFV